MEGLMETTSTAAVDRVKSFLDGIPFSNASVPNLERKLIQEKHKRCKLLAKARKFRFRIKTLLENLKAIEIEIDNSTIGIQSLEDKLRKGGEGNLKESDKSQATRPGDEPVLSDLNQYLQIKVEVEETDEDVLKGLPNLGIVKEEPFDEKDFPSTSYTRPDILPNTLVPPFLLGRNPGNDVSCPYESSSNIPSRCSASSKVSSTSNASSYVPSTSCVSSSPSTSSTNVASTSSARKKAALTFNAKKNITATSGAKKRSSVMAGESPNAKCVSVLKNNVADGTEMSEQVALKVQERTETDSTAIIDEFSLFGQFVATKLRNLKDRRTQLLAQNQITNILIQLELRNMDDTSLLDI